MDMALNVVQIILNITIIILIVKLIKQNKD